jgi:hypothetical protein
VLPTLIVCVDGLTVTDATGTRVTLIDALAVLPSHVAVITTGPPAATPVTNPVDDTLAIPLSLDVQATGRSESTFPLASSADALSCSEAPTTIVGVTPLMVTEATAAGDGAGGGGGGGGGAAGGAVISLPLHDRTMITPTILRRDRTA